MLIRPAKVPLETSFASLCRYIATLRNGLFAVAEDVDEKADKPTATAFSLPVTGWTLDEPEEESEETPGSLTFPYYYDFPVVGITAADRACVTVSNDSYSAAAACGLSPTNETLDPAAGDSTNTGHIRFRAVSIPTEAISAEYWIEPGKE